MAILVALLVFDADVMNRCHLSCILGMSEFCDSACAELAIVCRINKWQKNSKILQIIISNNGLCLALTAATPAQSISL